MTQVPTTLCYTDGKPSSLGFVAEKECFTDPRIVYRECFKPYLDPLEYSQARGENSSVVPKSHEEVRSCFRDFLQMLCSYIEEHLEDKISHTPWRNAKVEYVFSVPAKWAACDVARDFEKLVHEAGFGSAGSRHCVSVGRIDAEAVAVQTFKAHSASYVVSCTHIHARWL